MLFAVPLSKILFSIIFDGSYDLVDCSSSCRIRKVTFLFLVHSTNCSECNDVHSLTVWMTFKKRAIGKRMVSVFGTYIGTDNARRAIDEALWI